MTIREVEHIAIAERLDTVVGYAPGLRDERSPMGLARSSE